MAGDISGGRFVVLGMGGTIAGRAERAGDNVGYTAGQVRVEDLAAGLPALAGLALDFEQVAQINSKDMRLPELQRLVARVLAHLADDAVSAVIVTHGTDTIEETAWLLQTLLAPAKPVVRSLESLSRALARAATVEATRLERRVSFLATTASVSPFIGLFGTVWGIMIAFEDIGAAGSANLATVAPGISEALVNTAMGLLAAIPAAVFYNLFSSRIRVLTSMMDDFALEFLNIVERHFT